MTTSPQPLEDPIAAGRDALAAGAWADARDAFQRALERDGHSAEAWEGLGWAAWWLATRTLTLRGARAGLPRVTARPATPARRARVGGVAGRRLPRVPRRGRGRRGLAASARSGLLDGLPRRPPSTAGWPPRGHVRARASASDCRAARRALRRRAAALGRELGVADLEAVGLALEGIAARRPRAGRRRACAASTRRRRSRPREELRAADLAGLGPLLPDLGLRAASATSRARPSGARRCAAFAERWGARQLLGVCRSAYGRVLATRRRLGARRRPS